MPTYDYECKACGHVFETMHAMSAPPLKKCPECGKKALVRLISGGAGVIFKGSGFYETDYKKKREGSSSSKDDAKTETAKTEKSAETTKPDAKKPDVKSETKPKKDASSKKD